MSSTPYLHKDMLYRRSAEIGEFLTPTRTRIPLHILVQIEPF